MLVIVKGILKITYFDRFVMFSMFFANYKLFFFLTEYLDKFTSH